MEENTDSQDVKPSPSALAQVKIEVEEGSPSTTTNRSSNASTQQIKKSTIGSRRKVTRKKATAAAVSDESDEKKWLCSTCGKLFKEERYLEQHDQEKHLLQRPFSCSICERKFVRKWLMNVHIYRVHLGELSYSCTLCSRLFFSTSDLNRHERRHKGKLRGKKKLLQCDECHYWFPTQDELFNHSKKHQGQYKCPDCGKRWQDRSNFMKHLKIHTEGEKCQCKVCEKEFDHPRKLKKHVYRSHRTNCDEMSHPQSTSNTPNRL